MSRLELESIKEMSPAALRHWLLGSFVVASAFATAVIVIASSNFGSGLNTHRAGVPEITEVSLAQKSE